MGEAPGRHGARWTGVPFTSPHLLTGSGPKEASAAVVQRTLVELGRGSDVLLWNASVLFPPDNRDRDASRSSLCPVLERICRGRRVGRWAATLSGPPAPPTCAIPPTAAPAGSPKDCACSSADR